MIDWQDSLAIGVLEIDIQHKLLISKINDFFAACRKGAENDEVQRLFWFLEAYAVTHFKDEEQLMQRLGYPDYLSHRQMHREFAAEVGRLKERLRNEGASQSLVSSMTHFIASWLTEHISRQDRAIGRFANEGECPRPTSL